MCRAVRRNERQERGGQRGDWNTVGRQRGSEGKGKIEREKAGNGGGGRASVVR